MVQAMLCTCSFSYWSAMLVTLGAYMLISLSIINIIKITARPALMSTCYSLLTIFVSSLQWQTSTMAWRPVQTQMTRISYTLWRRTACRNPRSPMLTGPRCRTAMTPQQQYYPTMDPGTEVRYHHRNIWRFTFHSIFVKVNFGQPSPGLRLDFKIDLIIIF